MLGARMVDRGVIEAFPGAHYVGVRERVKPDSSSWGQVVPVFRVKAWRKPNEDMPDEAVIRRRLWLADFALMNQFAALVEGR